MDGRAACQQCLSICKSQRVLEDVSRWACRIGLASYAHVLCQGTVKERELAKQSLMAADWFRMRKSEVEEILGIPSTLQQVVAIKKKLLSIPRRIRSAKLEAWLQARVATLDPPSLDESEQSALSALTRSFCNSVSEGSIKVEDLQLAARVAAGGLQANKVVKALLQSFFDLRDTWLPFV